MIYSNKTDDLKRIKQASLCSLRETFFVIPWLFLLSIVLQQDPFVAISFRVKWRKRTVLMLYRRELSVLPCYALFSFILPKMILFTCSAILSRRS